MADDVGNQKYDDRVTAFILQLVPLITTLIHDTPFITVN